MADELDEQQSEGPTKQLTPPSGRQRVAREGPNTIRSEKVVLSLVTVDTEGDEPSLDEGEPDHPSPVEDVELKMVTYDTSEDPPSSDEGGEEDPSDPEVPVDVGSVELARVELDTSEDEDEDD